MVILPSEIQVARVPRLIHTEGEGEGEGEREREGEEERERERWCSEML